MWRGLAQLKNAKARSDSKCCDIKRRAKARPTCSQRVHHQMIERDALTTAIIEGALDAIITIDDSGHVIDFNPSAQRMFGYGAEDVRDKPIAELI